MAAVIQDLALVKSHPRPQFGGAGSRISTLEIKRVLLVRRGQSESGDVAAAKCRCMLSMVAPQQQHLGHDLVVSAVTLAGALGSLRFFDELARRDVFDKKLSRKLVHICVGLTFMLFWPLFSDAPRARYLAALAPAANAVRMVAFGTGLWENKAFVKAVSREGNNPKELLKGPLYYAVTISVATIAFWRSSPVGIVTIASLCAGDGFADIFGRKYGRRKLPYNSNKSVEGSIAMFVMGAAFSILYTLLFSQLGLGYFAMNLRTIRGILAVSLATMLVESLPVSTTLDDNLTVPATAMTVGLLTM